MKNKILTFISKTLKLIALLVPLVFLVNFAQENLFYYEDHNSRRIERFYEEEKNSIDVVLMGASEVTNDYSPGYAYEAFGFTSYMYTIDFNRGTAYLPQLKEVLKYQDPQVILVEVFGFMVPNTWDAHDDARFRLFVENIPYSWNRVEATLKQPFEDKISYLVPLVKYHGELGTAQERLMQLNDPEFEYPELKGMVSKPTIYQGEGEPGEPFNPEVFDLHPEMEKALIEFLEFCEKEKLDNIVFTNFPRILADESNNSYTFILEKIKKILNQYGHELLDLTDEAVGLDRSWHYGDAHHLNIYGQMAVTDYLGNLMLEEYGVVPVEQSPESQQKWEKCVEDTRIHISVMDALAMSGEEMGIDELSYKILNPGKIIGAG